MKNFIPVMRAKRLQEMQSYIEKGYSIQDKKHYMMLERIELAYMDDEYEYAIQVTQDEIYFFINKDNANGYLSIVEIYDLVEKMNRIDKGDFLSCLKKQLKQRRKNTSQFVCQGLSYKFKEPVELDEVRYVNIPQTGTRISNRELFLLILLIQEKSNALFKRSSGIKRKYVDGILRLLIILIEIKRDDPLLECLGWKWDRAKSRFVFSGKEEAKGREKFKYYLTNAEYDDRLRIKKS